MRDKDNPVDAQSRFSFDHALRPKTGKNRAVRVRMSKAAIASCIFAPFALAFFVPGVIAMLDPRTLNPNSALVKFVANVSILAIGVTLMLGLIGLALIALNAGRLTGTGFAAIGTIIPIVQLLILFAIPTFPGFRKTIPPRIVCGFNLSILGKAMLIYADDYDEKWPTAGGSNCTWASRIPNWKADNRFEAYDMQQDGSGGWGSISSSLYLLVKYCEVTPKYFVCKGDSGITEFKTAEYGLNNKDLTNLWDFGPNPQRHCSYSYHAPFRDYRLTTASEPGLAVAADRNPWMDSPFRKASNFRAFDPNGSPKALRTGNAIAHKEDGQNVLFLDNHVSFKKNSFCGVNNDNIYTYWDGADVRRGTPPKLGSQPVDRTDSLLVNDPAIPQ
jgi:hypothetical protein